MSRHALARSTSTLEISQVHELNERLSSGEHPVITAASLGLAGAAVDPRLSGPPSRIPRQNPQSELPGDYVLRSVAATGAPSFPYLYGIFQDEAGERCTLPSLLHTSQLSAISDVLYVRHQRWGL